MHQRREDLGNGVNETGPMIVSTSRCGRPVLVWYVDFCLEFWANGSKDFCRNDIVTCNFAVSQVFGDTHDLVPHWRVTVYNTTGGYN